MVHAPAAGQVSEYAQLAMAMMQDLGVPPSPENFGLWYNYFSGEMPDLKRAMDEVLDEDEEASEEKLQAIRRRFFADAMDADSLHGLADRMAAHLGTAAASLSKAGDDATRYGETLRSASGRISASGDRHDLDHVVSHLLAETQTMVEYSRTLERQIKASSTEITRLNEELDHARHDATTDGLTGLANRKRFDAALTHAADEAARSGASLCLLLIDIDHFKRFNDTYGHQVGDLVLKLLAAVLKSNVKGQDLPARYGGEEFAIILPNTPLPGALKLAETIREDVARKDLTERNAGSAAGRVTVSIGAACWRQGEPPTDLIRRADQALYKAKEAGRNRVLSDGEVNPRTLEFAS